jgi:hypothetical protein
LAVGGRKGIECDGMLTSLHGFSHGILGGRRGAFSKLNEAEK